MNYTLPHNPSMIDKDLVSENAAPFLRNNKAFKWLCSSSVISMLGDQLTLISLPWLALFLSPEPWVLGSVLAVMALPLSVFLLIGGAIVDRFSPKKVLLYSKYCNSLLMTSLALLLVSEQLTLPLLYLIALLIGICSAFAISAGSTLLPAIVKSPQLPVANSIGMTLRSLTMLIGPLLAAILLGIEGADANADGDISYQGLAMVFALDAGTFVVSALMLQNIYLTNYSSKSERQNILHSIGSGLRYFWQQRELRLLVLYIAMITSFLGGLMQVGLPLLVKNQWQEGPQNFGLMMTFFAGGNIFGMILVAKFSQAIRLSIGTSILLADTVVGVLLILLSQVVSSNQSFMILLIMGMVAGYVQVIFISWVQQQAGRDMLGRLMSIVMFGLIGLIPLSAAVTGLILQYVSTSTYIFYSGGLLFSIAVLAIIFSEIPTIGKESTV